MEQKRHSLSTRTPQVLLELLGLSTFWAHHFSIQGVRKKALYLALLDSVHTLIFIGHGQLLSHPERETNDRDPQHVSQSIGRSGCQNQPCGTDADQRQWNPKSGAISRVSNECSHPRLHATRPPPRGQHKDHPSWPSPKHRGLARAGVLMVHSAQSSESLGPAGMWHPSFNQGLESGKGVVGLGDELLADAVQGFLGGRFPLVPFQKSTNGQVRVVERPLP